MTNPPEGFAQTYGVELLFEQRPSFERDAMLESVRKYRPNAELMGEAKGKGNGGLSCSFLHPDHPVHLKDASVPAQTHILSMSEPYSVAPEFAGDVRQSWGFPEAASVLAACRHSLLVTDMMSGTLEPKARLGLFQDVLAGVLDVVPARAIHWRPSGCFLAADQFRAAYRQGGAARFFAGAINVRFASIEDAPGEMLMDTMGLAALGFPDLQCHFRDLDPNDVATVLLNSGCYIFEVGDVIQDGYTIEGTTAGSRWRCQHEEAMLAPRRTVVDFNPGAPHAGRREA